MGIFILFGFILGLHIIIARTWASYLSKFKFYLWVGLLEGLPLVGSAAALYLKIPYSLIFFLLASAFYLFLGTPIKQNLEQKARQNNSIAWEEWENKKTKIKTWEKIIFFLS